MKASVKGTDTRSILQDLKSNRRVQGALVALGVLTWFLWPTSGPAKPSESKRIAAATLGDRQTQELQKLPDLDKLDKAGQLPTEDRMLRDLFLFEGPPPPPPPAPKPPPPPPPPTEAELAARKLAQDRAGESASKPGDLRYLGYLGTAASGRLGAFMKGEDAISYKQGDLVNPHWRLVKISDISAEFQNVRFADLKHRIDAVDPRGGAGNAPTNDF